MILNSTPEANTCNKKEFLEGEHEASNSHSEKNSENTQRLQPQMVNK